MALGRKLKWLLLAVGVLAAVIVGVVLIGYSLPVKHTASVQVPVNGTPEQVFALITDVANAPTWRTGLERVAVHGREPLRFTELSTNGDITYVQDAYEAPRLFRSRIENGRALGFGGTWTWELQPSGDGTLLTITEHGEVYNPLFRVLSKYVFGHYSGLEQYASDVARRFGGTAQPTRDDDPRATP
jgi:hypothetical protein